MKLSSDCRECLLNKQKNNLKDYENEEIKQEYLLKVSEIVSKACDTENAPKVLSKINDLHNEYFNKNFSFTQLKKTYNNLMLKKEQDIFLKIITSKDRLIEAIKFARAGNYIDFGALGNVNDEKLNSLLDAVPSETIDIDTYNHFKNDLSKAEHLVYLTDNCGEIVLDKLLIKTIKETYPKIKIKVLVRGIPILNDAVMEDALDVGLDECAEVYGNGSDIPGTDLDDISTEAKDIIDKAEIIISKGQGNFETLHGCGLNIYYMFLCKCDLFVNRFNLEKFSGVFINEKNL